MTNTPDETHTSHAPQSQPSVHPGSDDAQTITAPTPPVAWNSHTPDQADRTDDTEQDHTPHEHDDQTPDPTTQND